MKRCYFGFALLAGACLLSAGSAFGGDLPESATSLAIARAGEPPVELARRQIVVGGGFYYGGAPVYAYRPYAYSYRPQYNYAYRPYNYGYNYGYPNCYGNYGYANYGYANYGYTNYYQPYAVNYYRPYVYNYGPYVTRYYGGSYRGRSYYCF